MLSILQLIMIHNIVDIKIELMYYFIFIILVITWKRLSLYLT